MSAARLHSQLIQACKNADVTTVKQCLSEGVDPNFNLKLPINALDIAVSMDNVEIITLLIEHGAVVKAFVLQKAIQRDKNYLGMLLPDFNTCKDINLLLAVLQAAINCDDIALVQQAIEQGATPASLYLSSIVNLSNREILKLLLHHDFNIHAENNMVLSEWMGSSRIGYEWTPEKLELLFYVCDYYLDKPEEIEKFSTLKGNEKSRLFLVGLGNNHLNMMKFALAIGVNKNEALNDALRNYSAFQEGNISDIHTMIYPNNPHGEIDYEIVEYILKSEMHFTNLTISNAVYFKYYDVLDALKEVADLEYGYEIAYKHEDDALCEYFNKRGVSKVSQDFARMKIEAVRGNVATLRNLVHEGVSLEALQTDILVEIIQANHVNMLKYLHEAGVLFSTSLNTHLDKAINQHKAYEAVSYLIETGLDITYVKNIPQAFKKRYPILFDMWQKRFSDIFDYTVYLTKELYPKAEHKEKEEMLKQISALATLPYVLKMSEEKARDY